MLVASVGECTSLLVDTDELEAPEEVLPHEVPMEASVVALLTVGDGEHSVLVFEEDTDWNWLVPLSDGATVSPGDNKECIEEDLLSDP